MKRSSEAIFRAALALGTVGLFGCGGTVVHERVVIHDSAPPLAETTTVEEPTEDVVIGEGPAREGEVVVVEEQADPVIHIQIEREYFARHPHYHRLHGEAVVNYNTGYLDGWAGADFFNHGQPLTDAQVDRMIEVGRRQGDPTGKLALVGYQEGYRSGAQRERNPYGRQMTVEQAKRFRTMRGLPAEAPRTDVKNETFVRVQSPEAEAQREAARKARLEAAQKNLEASKNNLSAEQARRDAEAKKLELARLEKEKARKDALEAAKQKREAEREQRELALKSKLEAEKKEREQRELAFKNKLEAEKKQRETEKQRREAERQQREVALKAKIEADRKAREEERKKQALARQQKEEARDAEDEAEKDERDGKRDQRQTALDKRRDDRKQKLAQKKADREAERDAKKSETADTSEQAK